jgi:hypothetical protein
MDGKLTGQVIGDIVDAQYKANTLTRLAEKYEIPVVQTVAIGDGANDLPMIKAAGLGIAYHAKPKVNEKTEVTIRHADLMGCSASFLAALIRNNGLLCRPGKRKRYPARSPHRNNEVHRGESSKTRICL